MPTQAWDMAPPKSAARLCRTVVAIPHEHFDMDDQSNCWLVAKLLACRKAEALAWLKGGSAQSFRNIGELETTEESVAFIERLYALGARSVLAVEIVLWEQGENTGKLLVELPRERFPRSELFEFEKQHAESMGFEGEPDRGQAYLFFKLD